MTFFRNPTPEQNPYADRSGDDWRVPALFEIHAYAKTSINPSVSRAIHFAAAQKSLLHWVLMGFGTVTIYAPDGEMLMRVEPHETAECYAGCGNFGTVNKATGVAMCDECASLYSPAEGGSGW